jgi:hypothetical protein
MNSREQTDAMSLAILWPSASVGKCGSCALKGQNRIAQGFNPGLVAPVRFALKGQQIRRDRLRFIPTTTRIYQPHSGATREALRSRPRPRILASGVMEFWSTGVLRLPGIAPRVRGVGSAFRARPPRTVNPGLKPWALMFNRFAVSP